MKGGTLSFLGTGTSVGVPMLGCDCAVCRSADPRNHRYRCSVLFRLPGGNLLIDTPPELRLQLLREGSPPVNAVLLTHYHADHLHGLDDLRPIPFQIGGPVPLLCDAETELRVRQAFSYAFSHGAQALTAGFVPQIALRRINHEPFDVLGERVIPVPMEHGPFHVLGFRVRNLAYCTDVKEIPRSSWPLLEDLDTLILGCLRRRPHPGHLSVSEALDIIDRLQPRQAFLTHIGHELDHAELEAELPPHVRVAHDGLAVDLH
ncbi:MAG: MBL fold metallo-hydrolase [Planctomycetes bacterium]|nr:MBL fold metallo-hydrolase [Planctomycetota bacterium]